MFIKVGLSFILILVLFSEIVAATTSEVVCYHGTWSRYRNGNGAFSVSNIDPSLCTILIYTFVGLSNNNNGSIVSLDSWLDDDLGNLKAFTALKASKSKPKILVAIGGWNEGSLKYSTVAASASLRSEFIQSALSYCKNNNFDGFDIDWEYPADRGGSTADKENFITLLKELSTVFKENNLIVTVAVRATATGVDLSYNVPGLSQYVDLINVMTYDIHGAYDGVLGHNAPLYASSSDITAAALELNVDAAITHWIYRGADPKKLVLGIPLYGRTFTLSNSNNVALGAPCSGAGTPGPYTQESGFLGYNEIVEKQLEGGWTEVWDDEQKVPHMYKGNQWISFDDPASVKLKVEYAKSKGLGGVMVWSLETDDFHGLSGVVNPLLTAINEQLGSSSRDSTNKYTATTVSVTTNSETKINTLGPSNSKDFSCIKGGYFRNPTDCSKYYYCYGPSATPRELSCSLGLYYDPISGNCNWMFLVKC